MIDRDLSARGDMIIAYRELEKSTTVEFILYHASLAITKKAVLLIPGDIFSAFISLEVYKLVLSEYSTSAHSAE